MIAFSLSSVCLLADNCLGLGPCFAGLNALVPRVLKVFVTCTSTVFEPRTTVSATTSFARFRDDAAFGAYGTGDRRSGGWYLYAGIGQDDEEKNAIIVNSHCLV